MDHWRQRQISRLNKASGEAAQNYATLVEEEHKLKTNQGDDYKKWNSTVNKVLESCAYQQQVNRELYTEPDDQTKMKPLHKLNYTEKKIFKHFLCKEDFETDQNGKNMCIKCTKIWWRISRILNLKQKLRV